MEPFNLHFSSTGSGVMGLLAWVAIVATAIVHICFATGVVFAIKRLRESGRKPWFVGTEVWALATLIGGVFVAAIYWLIHHSSFREDKD